MAILRAVFCAAVCLNLVLAVDYASDPTVELFREYLRINTTTGNDLTPAVDFWKRLAAEEDVPICVYEFTAGYPVIVIKWAGTDPSLSAVMLNSHMDVVTADEEDGWTYPPFDAYLTEDGLIYGRGTQDMKSVSIQYFVALRTLKRNGVTWLRNIFMTLMPDEEVGAPSGMIPFLQSEVFAELNVGVEMDEGTSYDLPMIAVFYQDKVVWQFQIDCHAEATHGSTFSDTNSTAIGKCYNVMTRFFEFRDEQYEISKSATLENAGIYTSVNLNRINGGTALNIVPPLVSLYFDVRLATTTNENEFEAEIREWVAAAGSNISLTFLQKNALSPATDVSDNNPYWVSLKQSAKDLGITILAVVPPGSTDARHVRNFGIPAFGFSPLPNTPMLLHAVNEFINATIFLNGINIYEEMIVNLANIPGNETSSNPSDYIVKNTS